MAYKTRTGKSPYGQCKDCGADRVRSPKTGKEFCSEKCWLPKSEQQQQLGDNIQPNVEERFEMISAWASNTQETVNTLISRVSALEKEIKELSNLKTLLIDVTNPSAVALHGSMSGKGNEDIPVIQPQGFDMVKMTNDILGKPIV
ncbi:MAG: hypothetical protein WC803_12790 [Sphingomonas sp.]|jgi:hypothetical protein